MSVSGEDVIGTKMPSCCATVLANPLAQQVAALEWLAFELMRERHQSFFFFFFFSVSLPARLSECVAESATGRQRAVSAVQLAV